MKYFTIEELTRSEVAKKRGIDNTPNEQELANLEALVDNILDPLRKAFRRPIYVNSGYRCAALNKAVGGSSTSQHLLGQAVDITAGKGASNKTLFALIKALKLPFDQLINEKPNSMAEPSWIHISYSPRHRRQVLTIR